MVDFLSESVFPIGGNLMLILIYLSNTTMTLLFVKKKKHLKLCLSQMDFKKSLTTMSLKLNFSFKKSQLPNLIDNKRNEDCSNSEFPVQTHMIMFFYRLS